MSAFLFTSYSCNDDDDNRTNPLEETKLYLPMHEGNYWVYDEYSVTPDGTETLRGQTTLSIKEEKILSRGKTFFRFQEKRGEMLINEYFRADSSGYLIDQAGKIYFSNINFTDTLHIYNDPGDSHLFSTKYKMKRSNIPISVPAGIFDNALDFCGDVTIYEQRSPWFEKGQELKKYYVKNVGVVFYDTYYVMSPNKIEYRLAKYHINGTTHPLE